MKCVCALAVAGLTATAAMAASGQTMVINLSKSVVANGVTLPSGQYRVTDMENLSGGHILVFRGANGEAVAMAALRTADAAVDQKTELVVTNDKLDKLFIEGESTGFQFATE